MSDVLKRRRKLVMAEYWINAAVLQMQQDGVDGRNQKLQGYKFALALVADEIDRLDGKQSDKLARGPGGGA